MTAISYDPLLTDIYEVIREKIGDNSTLTGILGVRTPTDMLRVYRMHPVTAATYPLVIMYLAGTDFFNHRGISVDFNINFSTYEKSVNKTNTDIISRELVGIFGDPGRQTKFNNDNTKIDQIIMSGGGFERFDDKFKTWITTIGIVVTARRKSHIF